MTQADRVHSTPPKSTSALSPDNPPPVAPESGHARLYVPTGVPAEELFQAIGRLRKEAQAEIDRLLAFLDDTSGDADYENDEREDDADLEPSLGAQEPGAYNVDQSRWGAAPTADLEDEHDGRESRDDDEPSLCGIGVCVTGCDDDRENDTSDDEPPFGSLNAVIDQDVAWRPGVAWEVDEDPDVALNAAEASQDTAVVRRKRGQSGRARQ